MAQYYFLGTYLQPLTVDELPEIRFQEFNQLLQENLSINDYVRTTVLRTLYDILNLRSYWKKEPLDPMGILDENDLEEALITGAGLPEYVYAFTDKYESLHEKLKHFPELLVLFFKTEIANATGFIKEYLQFERELRLVLVAFRAKKLNRNLLNELQFEDPEEDLIAQILAQKDSAHYEPPEKFEDLKPILLQYSEDPMGLEKALIQYRMEKIDQLLGIEMFSSDRIYGYLTQLILVENWHRLDRKKGLQIIDTIFKESA